MATQTSLQRPRCGRKLMPVLLCLGLALGVGNGPLTAASLTCLPMAVRVAERDGAPVAAATFVHGSVERANQIYEPYGVQFSATLGPPLPAAHAALITREDRDALAAFVAPSVINVFVVGSLMDIDEPGRVRRGVHWRARKHPQGAHYVIVSAISGPNVLAHELGHFLGNPQHSHVPGNLMSYQHTEALPVLDATQLARMQRAIRRYLRSGELKPAQRARRARPGPQLPCPAGSD